jgi:electron transport complex protein RnfD
MPAPHLSVNATVRGVMGRVLLALVPAIAVQAWLWGPGIFLQLTLATTAALATEAFMLKARGVAPAPFLGDLSAVTTAWLLALALPAIVPWWATVTGTVFAIAVAKHLYGGLGSNLFNPAMVGYAVLIVSFPAQMTRFTPIGAGLGFPEAAALIFTGGLPGGIDAVSAATPLDWVKTQLANQRTLGEIFAAPEASATALSAPLWLALAYLAGGAFLLQQRIIGWHVPAAFLVTLAAVAALFHGFDADRYAGAAFHLTHGAALIGAFFILTDPVSGPITPRGKLIFAAGAALLTWVIRTWGGYPDGVAFATLIMNMGVPLLDAYTQPAVYGHGKAARPPEDGA